MKQDPVTYEYFARQVALASTHDEFVVDEPARGYYSSWGTIREIRYELDRSYISLTIVNDLGEKHHLEYEGDKLVEPVEG